MKEASPKGIVPPSSKESEMMVLGCMLTSINSLNVAADSLNSYDFYYTEHQTIFDILKTAYKQDKPADVHLVCEELKRQDKLSAVGGVSYVTTLAQYAGTSAYTEEYVEVVRNKATLRRMIHVAQEIEKSALQNPPDVSLVLDEAQQKLFNIGQAVNPMGGVLVKDILTGVKASSKIPYLKELQQKQETFQTKGPDDSGITGIPTHFIDLDKMINGMGPSNLMILAARPAMGKCVTGDTLILDPSTGALRCIKDLVSTKSGYVTTLDKNLGLKTAKPSAYVADGIKPTFKIKTALGKELEATAVHPLLTIKGWKRLEELKTGEPIAVPRSLPYFGTNQWPEHKVKALAYFIAHGSLTESSPAFTNVHSNMVADFTKALYAFGNVHIRKDTHSRRAPTYIVSLDRSPLKELKDRFSQALLDLSKARKRSVHEILKRMGFCVTNVYHWAAAQSLPSGNLSLSLEAEFPELPSLSKATRENPVTSWLTSVGWDRKEAHQKTLPDAVFELTKENLALLLNRLFSCDGTAYVASRGGRPFPGIAYSSVSKTLIYQVQHILLRFGILAKIRSKKTTCKGEVFSSFELEISGKSDLIRFCQDIGIYGKEVAVSEVIETALSSPIDWTTETLPLEVWDLIRQKKGQRDWVSLFKAKGLKAPSNIQDDTRSIHRETLAKIAKALDDQDLKDLANSDIYWDRITSIEPTGEKEVFDLSVKDTHNFVANDILVHNTSLAINIAENICFKNEVPVGVFSLEMTAEQLLHRIICSQAEVESEKIKTGSLNGIEFQRVVAAVNAMQRGVMVIDDQPGLKITDLRARARRMKESHGIQFLVIDYLQLLSGSGLSKSAENRQNEISEISRMLKTLARELDLPILCLSQLSRKVEERQGHRPMMSDLRESGCLTGDAEIRDAHTGKIYTIRELAERKEQTPIFVHGVDDNLTVGPHKMLRAFYSGKKEVYELKTRSGRSLKASANHPFLKLEGWTRLDQLSKGTRIALPMLSTQLETELSEKLALFTSEVYWDEIVSIEKRGVEDVYDATVEHVHNFVANDIIVHNSIEQDSDIVMFLLRREYYDPYDKPGMAELIVAKNRHGSVGSVNLTFRKELAQFANYSGIPNSKIDDNQEAFSAFSPG